LKRKKTRIIAINSQKKKGKKRNREKEEWGKEKDRPRLPFIEIKSFHREIFDQIITIIKTSKWCNISWYIWIYLPFRVHRIK
jgi:hypothetical protein